jgi:type IV secretion system protein VirD4
MRLARLALQVTVVVWAGFVLAGLIVGLAQAPGLALFGMLALALFGAKQRFVGSAWTFGSARLSRVEDLARAGFLGAPSGLLVCQVKVPFWLACKLLFKLRSHAQACVLFFAALNRRPVPVRVNSGVHTLIVAPSGAGKGVSLVIPTLLTDDTSAIVLDVKGELVRETAAARRKMGHRVVVLDPFGKVNGRDTFNPLSVIDSDDAAGLEDVKALSEAAVARQGTEHEPHWNNSAEMFISAVTGFVAQAATGAHRNLQTVALVLADPAELAGATKAMQASPAWGGMLARMGAQLGHFADREKGSVLTTANRHLNFLNTPMVAANTKETSFDPYTLKAGKMTVYLVIPPEYLRSHSGLLRLWLAALQRAVVKSGPGEQRKVNFLIDEAGALGNLPFALDALTQLRGYGVRVTLVYQSLGQLKTCFPDGQDQTVLSNTDVQIYFGINDYATADEAVSKRIGMCTVPNWSENGGESTSHSTDGNGSPSTSTNRNTGYSVSEVGRAVLQPEEIMQLSQREAIVFAPHVPPVHCWLVRYYERSFRRAIHRLTRFGRFLMTVRSLGLAASSLLLAGVMLHAVHTAQRVPQHPAPDRQVK